MRIFRFMVFFPILFALSCSGENDPSIHTPAGKILTIQGKQQYDTVFVNLIVPEKMIRAQRTGKLERLAELREFKKNSLLVQFDDYDVFVELSGEKEALREDLTHQLDNFPQLLKPVEKKWRDFAGKLTPDKLLPAFPSIAYREEAAFFEEAGIKEKYQAILSKESTILDYFQLSTEDGFLVKSYAHTDDYVKKNSPLISYHPKKIKATAEASFPLSGPITKQLKTNFLVRLPVDSVKITQKTTNKITYSLILNQRLSPKNCPSYFVVRLDNHVFRVPKEFIGKNNKVLVLGEKEQFQVYKLNGSSVIYSKKPVLKIQQQSFPNRSI